MTLGEIIKKYRLDHEMSMDAFASKSGMSKAYISILEKNKHPKTGRPVTPSIHSIKQAASGMGMDFNVLFGMIDGDVSLSASEDVDSDPHSHVDVPDLIFDVLESKYSRLLLEYAAILKKMDLHEEGSDDNG